MKQSQAEVPRLVLEMESAIKRLARRLGIHDQERVFQDVCVHCWRRCDLLSRSRNPAVWITTVTKNAAKLVHRQQQYRAAPILTEYEPTRRLRGTDSTSPLAQIEQAEVCSAIQRAVAELRSPFRDVIIACDLDGQSLAEFAARVGRPIETCRTHQKRARKQLAADSTLQSLSGNSKNAVTNKEHDK